MCLGLLRGEDPTYGTTSGPNLTMLINTYISFTARDCAFCTV
jgi:hypothetical protein